MLKEMMPVSIHDVVKEIAAIKIAGYRFITISCVPVDEAHFDILYHFDRELELRHLRLTVTKDIVVPSISSVYFAAFLAENEVQDLFGIHFDGMAIDYKGTLFLEKTPHTTPFCKYTVQGSSTERGKPRPASPNSHTREDQ